MPRPVQVMSLELFVCGGVVGRRHGIVEDVVVVDTVERRRVGSGAQQATFGGQRQLVALQHLSSYAAVLHM